MRLFGFLLLAAMLGLASGCFSMRVVAGNHVPPERATQIQPGQTTKAEVLDWFGAPEDYTDPSGLRQIFADGVTNELVPMLRSMPPVRTASQWPATSI